MRRQICFFAKAKIAPSPKKSLPTLELLSVFLGLKCLPDILNAFPSATFRTLTIAVDAQVVLNWLLSKEIKTSKNIFVKNRLKDILVLIENLKKQFNCEVRFRFVKSELNPSDMLTRPMSAQKFVDNRKIWSRGPEWLNKTDVKWPESPLPCLSKQQKDIVQPPLNVNLVADESQHNTSSVIDFKKYSTFHRLYNVVEILFKVLKKVRPEINVSTKTLNFLIKSTQKVSFSNEINFLSSEPKGQAPNLVGQLNLFLDDQGILRSAGRIDKSVHVNEEIQSPRLLGKNDYVTQLIVEQCHKEVKHLGTNSTLHQVRKSGFWIPQGRQVIHKILRKCIICKKVNSLPYKSPNLTVLPKHRVNLVHPFAQTGIDFTGSIAVEMNGQMSKMYILIFTCLATRAIHLELIPDMSASSFVQGLIRFSNLFSLPDYIYSDNAKSFIKGFSAFKRFFQSDEFREKLNVAGIQHIRQPNLAPWYGSCFERCIKTVKTCIRKEIGRGTVEYFQMLTLLSDIQLAINSRPLTYQTKDEELAVISPIDFINPLAKSNIFLRSGEETLQPGKLASRDMLVETLLVRDRMIKYAEEEWKTAYLLSLRENYSKKCLSKTENKIKVNEIVLVKNPLKAKVYWSLAEVTEFVPSSDGVVRAAFVRLSNGETKKYPIVNLYPLEINTRVTDTLTDSAETNKPDELTESEDEIYTDASENPPLVEINNPDNRPTYNPDARPARKKIPNTRYFNDMYDNN